MDNGKAKGAAEFGPPKYLASLIAAINDGAKAAQGGALAFLLVGIYLLATAFSSSDEDLLLGKTVTISQIGASLPVSFSFAIAPLVFVFVHLYTLARYDMLAANARYFVGKLRQDVPTETDREDYRQLLANGEFLAALTAPRGSGLYSRIWPWLFRGMVVVFPVAVVLLVQVNALRYQSDLIMWVQRAALALDLLALTWFFRRNSLNGSKWPDRRLARVWRWARLLWLPAVVVALNFLYLSVVPADANVNLVRYSEWRFFRYSEWRIYRENFFPILRNPLDTLLCPLLNWGCRYLRVDHRTLVGHVWDAQAMADLQAPGAELAKALARIEGVVLRDRSLRFAVLNESLLYAADLSRADLRGADLVGVKLQGANLRLAKLQGVTLSGAKLQAANLSDAELQFASLGGANLQGADLSEATLQGAELQFSDLQLANLRKANLQGAVLSNANLQLAHLQGANLQGADLSEAKLQGADLTSADFQGANLQLARLWHVLSTERPANFALGDMRGSDFHTALNDGERRDLLQSAKALLGYLKFVAEKLHVLNTDPPLDDFDFVASRERPILVSSPPEPALTRHPDWLITEPTAAYTGALAGYLASELAPTDPTIAAGIALIYLNRSLSLVAPYSPRDVDVPIACRLLSETMAGRVRLEQQRVDRLSLALKDRDCPTAAPAVSGASDFRSKAP
jgi:uncharacterized protein YjbI with pentapeptide repeats